VARGIDTGHHPGRQVGRYNWRGTGVWEVTQPSMGKLTSHANYNMEGPTGIEMGAWQGPKGHTAEVRHYGYESQGIGKRPDVEETTYHAGPFKTQRRAQIAASGLAGRVEAGRAERYR
jgi:hypothetical protein